MITFPALYLLGAFALVIFILVIFIFLHLYHGFRFGRHDPLTMGVNSAFVIVTVSILVLTVMFLLPVDWSSDFSLSAPTTSIPSINTPLNANDFPSLVPEE